MNRTNERCLPCLHIVVALSSLLIAIISVAAAMNINNQVAQGQNATTTANQTATNQSTAALPFGNMTQADLQGVKDRLNTARDAILDGDDETAYDALNDADSELYGRTN